MATIRHVHRNRQTGDDAIHGHSQMRLRFSAGLAALMAATPSNGFAEPPSGMVGLAATVESGPLRGEAAGVGALPYLKLEWEGFALDPSGLTYTLPKRDGFSLGGVATYRLSDMELSAESYFAGLDRDPAAEIGFLAGYEGNIGKIQFKALGDVSGAHDGYELSAAYAYPVQIGKWGFEPGFAVSRLSSDLANWSYGVATSEARGDRQAYDLDESWSAQLNLSVNRPITERWIFFGEANVGALDDQTADSPLVERRAFGGAMFGVGYAF